MELSRRDFLKLSGTGMGSMAFLTGLDWKTAQAGTLPAVPLRKRIGENTTICPYDGSGCGFLVGVEDGKVVNIEGDPDHPVNRGAACSKGASM
ncbi:MAG: twin-arginine translocation signal domain-containing protein, partial [Chloroflexota bacterium]